MLPDETHTTTFVIAMLRMNGETSCESSSVQAVRKPGAGSIAPAEVTKRETHCCLGTSNQVRLHEGLCGVFWAGEGAFAGVPSTIPGDCGQRSCGDSSRECKRTSCRDPRTGSGWPRAGGCQQGSCRKLGSTANEFCGSEAESDVSTKHQKLMAGMPIMHETDVDVNVDACKMVVLATMPDEQEQWTQQVINWSKALRG